MNVARLNFSHGSHESHLQVVNNIREAVATTGRHCAIMLDTKGPEIRTGLFKDGKSVQIKQGQELMIHCTKDYNTYVGTVNEICVDYSNLPKVVQIGSLIKIDDGLLVTKVLATDEKEGWVRVQCVNSADLGQRKGCNLPGTR